MFCDANDSNFPDHSSLIKVYGRYIVIQPQGMLYEINIFACARFSQLTSLSEPGTMKLG